MKFFIFLICLAGPLIPHAVTFEEGTVTFLQTHNTPDAYVADSARTNQRFFVRLSGSITDDECSNDYWFGYFDTEASKAQYSAILAASLSAKSIRLEATSSTDCNGGALLIRNVIAAW